MKKSRIEKLIPIANQVLTEQRQASNGDADRTILRADNTIQKNYDGKVSGFGISVAMSGLRPALAMYFNKSSDVKTRPILEAIANIIAKDALYTTLTDPTAKGLLAHALELNDAGLKELKKYVLEASIALKQIVRTYELV